MLQVHKDRIAAQPDRCLSFVRPMADDPLSLQFDLPANGTARYTSYP